MESEMRLILILRIVVVSLILSQASGSSLLTTVRKLVVAPGPAAVDPNKISPAPIPNPSIVIARNESSAAPTGNKGSVDPTGSPNGKKQSSILTDESCEETPHSCQQQNLTACVQFAEKVPGESWLLVQNGGDGALRVNASFLPPNTNFTDIILLKSESRKVNISAILRGSQLIVLHTENGTCEIRMGPSVPAAPASDGNFFQRLPYAEQVTPVHGVIIFSAAVLIVGGIWACCKSQTKERQGDGVPYQELEMGQSNTTSALNLEEGGSGEGWDEVWDDDWDDDQGAIRSPRGDQLVSNPSVNGIYSKSSPKEGWDEDWED